MASDREGGVVAFTGVYDADGTLAGELSYWVGAHVTGTRHCALCEITHGTFREKRRWRELAAELPVPFEAVHLDEQPEGLAAVTAGRTPCVAARRPDGSFEIVLGPAELDALGGDPQRLAGALARLA